MSSDHHEPRNESSTARSSSKSACSRSNRLPRARFGRVVAGLGCLCIVSVAQSARADWYDDAIGVIEQLIEDNIATVAVPNAASKLPVACEFFPSTIYALEGKRYQGLPTIIRKEAADAVGLLIYNKVADVTSSTVPAPGGAQINAFSLQMLTTAASKPRGSTVGEVAYNTTKGQAPPQDICSFPSGNPSEKDGQTQAPPAGESKATIAMRACAQPQPGPSQELACSAALLTRDAANGDTSLLAGDLRRIGSAVVVIEMGQVVPTEKFANAVTALSAAFTKGGLDEEITRASCAAIDHPMPAPLAPVPVPSAADQAAYSKALTEYTNCAGAFTKAAAFVQARSLRSDIVTLEQALASAGVIAGTCKDTNRQCKLIGELVTTSDRVVGDIQSKNFGDAAGALLDVADQIECTNGETVFDASKPGCSSTDQAVWRFLRALAVYSIDSETSSNQTASADADFKKAAVELIEATSGAGIRRRLWTHWNWVWLPEFAIRDAWRPGHIGGSQSELLVYPSIDLLRFRIRPVDWWRSAILGLPPSQTLYLGIHGSLLDALGPITEGATRDISLRSSSNAVNVFWFGFVVPRIDVELGVPELTKNVVVGFGGAMRFFRAEGAPGNAIYCVFGSHCNVNGVDEGTGLTGNNLEGSVFVKYVP